MKRNGKQKYTARDMQRQQAKDAMPEVKALVLKYGRMAVGNCLNKIRARDKELKSLEKLKRELAEREKALR